MEASTDVRCYCLQSDRYVTVLQVTSMDWPVFLRANNVQVLAAATIALCEALGGARSSVALPVDWRYLRKRSTAV